MHRTIADLKLEYERGEGCLVLLRTERDVRLVQPGLQVFREDGVKFKELYPVATRRVELVINPDMAFFGALHLPHDEVGNCRQFALKLKNHAQRLGVKFCFNSSVTQIVTSKKLALTVAGEDGALPFEAAIMCASMEPARLLAPLGLNIPLAAVHGYSITAVIREQFNAPRSAVMDDHCKVAISRMGNRVRAAGSAEVGGSPEKKRTHSLQSIYKVLHHWFPGDANHSGAVQEWKGSRPTLPEGRPIFGPSGISGLWLNLGHSFNGWALSCGCARAMADQLSGKAQHLNVAGFCVERLRA